MTRPPARRSILLVCPEIPAPPTWGFAVRVHHLAVHLGRRHRVSLIGYGRLRDQSDWVDLAGMVHRVRVVPPPSTLARRRWHQLASLVSPSSFHLTTLHSQAMQQAIGELLAEDHVDLVQVESSALMCFDFGSVPLVLDEHNIEYDLLRQVAGVERSLLRRGFGAVDSLKARREERRAWERAQCCVATSPEDEAVIRAAHPSACTAVVPNGVDTDAFRPSGEPADPERLLFVGKMNYRPNADAVVWFARHVLPRVRRSRPSTLFEVVGSDVPASLRGLPGVTWTGWVGDVRPSLEHAGVVVAPLRAGGGTRLKILEGLAMAKPVVSTSLGATGIDAVPGRHLIVADDPDGMADQILRLMSDAGLRARLGAEGRALVLRRYGWAAAARRLDDFHGQITMRAGCP